jgi:hypothetical protein
MRKNKIVVIMGFLMVLVFTISACKTTPKAAPAPAPAPVEEKAPVAPPATTVKPVDDALTALRDKMEALRAEGIKYGINTLKADEWAKAEATRAIGLEAYGKDYDLAKTSFEGAISQYESILKSSFDQISASLEAEILKAREDAIRAGAKDFYPEQFALGDDAMNQANDFRNKDDFPSAYDAGQIALMRFQSLQNAMAAIDLKQKIVKNDFAQYDQADFDNAGVKFDEAAQAYGTADAAALEAVKSSVALYTAVNNAGFKVWCQDQNTKVTDVKNLCDSIKAKNAAKNDYAKALATYDASQKYADAGNWESSYYAGADALDAFTAIYQDVSLRRNAADAAISAAKNRQAEGSELARQADERLPLADDATGYSTELPVVEESATEAPVTEEVAK